MSDVDWQDRMAQVRAHKARNVAIAAGRVPDHADEIVGDVQRFALSDIPEWGEWLVSRLSERYPGISGPVFIGKLHGAIASNDFLFVRNDHAALMISGAPRFLDGGLVFIEVFAFSRDAMKTPVAKDGHLMLPAAGPEERALALLYRHARDWCKMKKAARLFLGQCSDMATDRIKEAVGGTNCGWVSVKL